MNRGVGDKQHLYSPSGRASIRGAPGGRAGGGRARQRGCSPTRLWYAGVETLAEHSNGRGHGSAGGASGHRRSCPNRQSIFVDVKSGHGVVEKGGGSSTLFTLRRWEAGRRGGGAPT